MLTLVILMISSQVIIKLSNKHLIVKHSARQQNKVQSFVTIIALIPLVMYDPLIIGTPLSLTLLAIGSITVIATTVLRGKMLETIPSYVIQSVSIWVFIETFIIDLMIGVVPIEILMIVSILAKGVGM